MSLKNAPTLPNLTFEMKNAPDMNFFRGIVFSDKCVSVAFKNKQRLIIKF